MVVFAWALLEEGTFKLSLECLDSSWPGGWGQEWERAVSLSASSLNTT